MHLIKNGTLHCGSGIIKPDTDLLVDGNIIKKIGVGIIEPKAVIIDASGKDVFPGFILPCTSTGLVDYTDFKIGDQNETSDPITPQMHVKYALDRREIYLQQYHYSGITAFGASPGINNIISGQMGVYHTAGKSIKDMCIKETAAVKGNFSTSVKRAYGKRGVAPMTKMGIASILRKSLIDAKTWQAKDEKDHDEKMEILCKILDREIPFLMNAETASEINSIIDIAREFNIKLVIHNAFQPEKCRELILEHQIPVMLGQLQSDGKSISYDTDLKAILEMQREGALICLSNSGDTGFSGREPLLWSAIRMCQAGGDPESVLDMLTINPAKALDVEDKIGSIETGKQADLVIFDGHPLKTYNAHVECFMVSGEIIYQGTGEFEKCCL